MIYSRSATIRVGLFVFAMLLTIACLLIWKSSVLLRTNGYEVNGSFQNVAGLLDGASVRYRGYKIGKVAKITPGPQAIVVQFWVGSDIKIPKGSHLRIAFDGLIGEKYVEVIPDPDATEMIVSGETLEGYSTRSLADFVDVGTQVLEESKSILGSVRGVLQQEDVLEAMRRSILSVDRITYNLANTTDGIGSPETQRNIQELIANLNATVGSLKVAIKDQNAAGNLAQTADNLQVFSRELKNMASDGTIHDEVLGSIQQGRSLLKQSDNLVSKINQIKLDGDADVRYYGGEKISAFNANAEIHNGPGFLRFGIGNRLGDNRLLNFEPGIFLTDNVAARVGMINTKPGVGLDLYPIKRLKLSADVYDVNSIKYEVLLKYRVLDNFSVFGGIAPEPSNKSVEYNAGISIHPTPTDPNR